MLNVKTVKETKVIIDTLVQEKADMEEVFIQDAMGRVLAEDLYSNENIPNFTRSTVDGYCVKASDVFGCTDTMPIMLKDLGSVKMGEYPTYIVKTGQCAYIPTGACMPEGTDSVVMIEHTENYEYEVGILKPVAPGDNVIFEGDDMKRGELLLRKGTKIDSRKCGLLAASGINTIKVKKKIRVGVISTGNELVSGEKELQKGQIYDVNGPMLIVALKECGCTADFLGIIQDEEERFEEMLRYAVKEYDMVLISGGTSVGTRDLTAKILRKIGTIQVHGIAVKPGKPTIVANLNEKIVFGLPGNPMAVYFIYYLFVRNAINNMYGYSEIQRMEKKRLSVSISSNHGREEYIPVKIEEEKACPIRGKSGLISMLKDADGYIYIERDMEGISSGTTVNVICF